MPTRQRAPRPSTGRARTTKPGPQPQRQPSTDDPRIMLDRQVGALYEPIPPYPTRTEREGEFYTLGDGEMFLNVGPHHPATHGVLRLVLKLSGEQVVDVDPVLGYLHRGVEKICENSDYYHVIDQVDPLEYVSSLFQEWPAVLSFEKLMDVQVPRRAEYIRVLSGELLRVSSHILYLGFYALDLGGLTPILYSFIERDEIVEMLAALTGARMLFNYFRIGGVNGDLNHEFMSRLGDWMTRAAKEAESQATLLNENEIFVRRTRGVGILDRATALRYGVTGGNLRASGVPFDVRRAHPYSVYPELDFNIPTRDEGDSLARYLIRIDEIRESIKIIDQCLHNMPDGPVMASLPRLIRPRPGRAWGAVEGPRGMLGVYAISDGSDQPFRFRIHDPSFLNLETMPALLPGSLLADTMTIIASLDPVMGGIDK
jgi:NADH-quinone oxidoreductase subunit D